MKILKSGFALVAASLLSLAARAQQPTVVYTDASAFPVYGKCVDTTSARYERLPASCEQFCRPAVWRLGRNSAGLYIRFRSDSPSVRARWESLQKNHMPHQADAGCNGLDLYILDDGQWRFAGSGFVWGQDTLKTARLVGNMTPRMREYMLYLSLYDGVKRLEIGVEEGSILEGPSVDSPKSDRPVVMYGTSILQGGCASRPGMAFTNILARRLDREVINLGFSGNALLDYEIAQLMAQVADPAVFVLDYVPNASAQQIAGKGERFFRILRDAHPGVPVVFVEDPLYPHSAFDRKIRAEIAAKNEAQHALFLKLKKAGEKKLYYIPADRLIGTDGEATVDGVHFTDLGMMRYAEAVLPVLRKALRER